MNHKEEILDAEGIIVSDSDLDIAFIKIPGSDHTPLTVPAANAPFELIGSSVFALGHPEGHVFTFSEGIISGIRYYSDTHSGVEYQFTNPISGGNSGGALLNTYGELVGITSSVFQYDSNIVDVQNINFAVEIESALSVLNN